MLSSRTCMSSSRRSQIQRSLTSKTSAGPKRYFIIIDDIWDASAWDIIRCALPENMRGSRVMTTTRIETVGRACCSNNIKFVYKMKALSDQDSRILFFKRIFGSEDACPLYLKEVSVEILRKCGGLPLAIITISSLLANQPNKLKEQWEYVLKSLVGSNFEVSPSLIGMRQILNLSYTNLPHYLKTCMLYLAIYPEDYTIHKIDLARQWVAEGFIIKSHGIDPEDVAKSYFNELINRCMIQPSHIDCTGEVMSCRVHDMMLDLILQKCREENFVTVIDDIQDIAGQREKIRRLSLNLDGPINERVVESVLLSQIRMLAIFGTTPYLPPFLQFKHLRVLTIEYAEGSSSSLWSSSLIDLTGICHLFQLRYIKIKTVYFGLIVLPKQIKGLHQLQVFHIEGMYSYDLLEFPTDIVHMDQLLHLDVPPWIMLPDRIDMMKSLRTLHSFNLCSKNLAENMKGLRELTNLTDLQISCHSYRCDNCDRVEVGREVLRSCLEKLYNLKYLSLNVCFAKAYSDVLSPSVPPSSSCHLQRFNGSVFSRVPRWFGEIPSLSDLHLMVHSVLEDDVGLLAQLPSLMYLSLHIRRIPGDKIIICGGSGFPVLKDFTVACCRLSYLNFEAAAMTKLERLELRFNTRGWDRYGAAPVGIENLSGLKEICVKIGDNSAKESNRSAAESVLRDAAGMHPNRPVANIKIGNGVYNFDEPNYHEE